jgi:ribosomal-protein-alanine N-acetyltransferase
VAEAAGAEEAAALAAIEAVCIPGGWDERAFGSILRAPGTRVLLLRHLAPGAHGLPIVAYAVMREVADEVEVLSLGVVPRLRGRGLGRWLLRLGLRQAAGRGMRTAFLEVRPSNEPARRLYAAAGFVQSGRRAAYYREPPEDALVLRCALHPSRSNDETKDS